MHLCCLFHTPAAVVATAHTAAQPFPTPLSRKRQPLLQQSLVLWGPKVSLKRAESNLQPQTSRFSNTLANHSWPITLARTDAAAMHVTEASPFTTVCTGVSSSPAGFLRHSSSSSSHQCFQRTRAQHTNTRTTLQTPRQHAHSLSPHKPHTRRGVWPGICNLFREALSRANTPVAVNQQVVGFEPRTRKALHCCPHHQQGRLQDVDAVDGAGINHSPGGTGMGSGSGSGCGAGGCLPCACV